MNELQKSNYLLRVELILSNMLRRRAGKDIPIFRLCG
jgi:hypothetical protein